MVLPFCELTRHSFRMGGGSPTPLTVQPLRVPGAWCSLGTLWSMPKIFDRMGAAIEKQVTAPHPRSPAPISCGQTCRSGVTRYNR